MPCSNCDNLKHIRESRGECHGFDCSEGITECSKGYDPEDCPIANEEIMKITVEIDNFTFEAKVEKLEDGQIKANDNIMPSADFVVWLGDTVLGLLDKEGGK